MDEESLKNELKKKLIMLGAEESDLDEIIQDVNDIVVQRSIKEYLSTITDSAVLEATQHLSGPELVDYVKEHSSDFPPFSEERFKQIAEDTWKEYFDFMDK